MKGVRTILIAAAIGVAGCGRSGIKGDGVIRTEDRSVTGFSRVVVTGGYQVKWSSGKTALTISADQNLLPLINTVVSGNTLRIDSKENLAPTKSITVVLSSPSLAAVELTGGNSFKASQLSGPELKVGGTGASEVTVEGSVTRLEANLTGAGHLNAKSLLTQNATLSLVGASNAEVAVSDTLDVSITGAGSLTYHGNPKSVTKHITGAGSLRHQPTPTPEAPAPKTL